MIYKQKLIKLESQFINFDIFSPYDVEFLRMINKVYLELINFNYRYLDEFILLKYLGILVEKAFEWDFVGEFIDFDFGFLNKRLCLNNGLFQV